MRAVFYDTWAFLALANARDPDHRASLEADRWLEENGFVSITSDYVLDETLTGLNVVAGSQVALKFVEIIQARAEAEELMLLEVNTLRRAAALSFFRRLSPSERRLSFTDCTSFALMRELGCHTAFTADRHFHRAGDGISPLFERQGAVLTLKRPSLTT